MLNSLSLKNIITMRAAVLCLTAFLMVMGIGTSSVSAATVDDGDYTYESYRSGTTTYAKVKKYNGTDTDLILPMTESGKVDFSEYNKDRDLIQVGLELTSAQKTNITSVTIPEGYTEIDGSVFAGCTALKTVNLPASMKQISPSAFKDCTALERVNFADGTASVNLGLQSFTGCTSLKSITLPAGVRTTNGMNVFFGSSSLKEIEILNGTDYFTVDGIMFCKNGDAAKLVAYPEGKATAKLTLPENAGDLAVTETGLHALRNNKTLEEVVIPASYKSMGSFALNGCSNLKKITIVSEEFSTSGNSYTFQDIADGSVIYVATDEIKAGLEANTNCYTQGKTTFEVFQDAGPSKLDVNGDGEVDMLDLTTTQIHYQFSSDDASWETASAADVNEDNVVNIADLIMIYAEIYKAQ